MDSVDRQLLALLRRDARASVAHLAAALGVSRGTVTNRMQRLEADGVVKGYTIRLAPDADRESIRAWMMVQVEGTQTRKVIESLLGEPGVEALYDTNGRWDLLVDLRVPSMIELSQLLSRIRLIKGIAASETSIHLATFR